MANPNTPQQALARLQNLCSRGEKCIADVRQKLITWQIDAEDSAEIIKVLVEDKYIDEERYATAFVRDKSRFSHWGALKIQAALKAKRIPDDIIKTALKELDELNYEDELQDILAKKAKTIKAADTNDLKTKLIRFGLSRGFEYNLVYKKAQEVIKQYIEE